MTTPIAPGSPKAVASSDPIIPQDQRIGVDPNAPGSSGGVAVVAGPASSDELAKKNAALGLELIQTRKFDAAVEVLQFEFNRERQGTDGFQGQDGDSHTASNMNVDICARLAVALGRTGKTDEAIQVLGFSPAHFKKFINLSMANSRMARETAQTDPARSAQYKRQSMEVAGEAKRVESKPGQARDMIRSDNDYKWLRKADDVDYNAMMEQIR